MSFKNFLRGCGSIFNLYPSKKDAPFKMVILSDEEAIRSDWENIGNDLYRAMGHLYHEEKAIT